MIMKIKLNIILLVSLCLCQSMRAQISFPKDADERKIISTLFESKYDLADSTYKWMPNISESVQFDCKPKKDTLYTKIIASFNLKEEDVLKKIIVTSTNTFNNSCHACQPSLGIIELELNKETDSLNVIYSNKFVKHFGTWGEAPTDIKLMQIGKDGVMGILIKENYSGGGTEGESISIFRKGIEIYSFISFLDIRGFGNKSSYQKFRRNIWYDKKSNTIKITKKGKDYNDLVKTAMVNSISTYEYDGYFLTKKTTKNILEKN